MTRITSPQKTQVGLRESRVGFLTLLSIAVGLVAGVIAFILYHLIGLFTNLFYYQRLSFSFVTPSGTHLGLLIVAIPVIGGMGAGLMIKYGSNKIIGHGIPETMESVLLNSSIVEPKVGVLKALSASLTIGSGQPFGAEGPIIQTGGAFGSFVGQLVDLTGSERRILLASGAAAGMAATFGTPISASLLVIELLLFEFRVRSLLPVGVAAALGGAMHVLLITPQPLFVTPAYSLQLSSTGIAVLPLFAVLGVLCGITGSVLSKGLYKSEDVFRRLPLGQPWLPMIGGLCVGIIGLEVPQILGVGYSTITDMLNGHVLFELATVILVAKACAWILAMGSQTSGGTLAPLFLIGSSLGYLFGVAISGPLSDLGIVPGAFAVAGLAAVFGTASRAPFASFVFALEVTQDFYIAIPVVIAVLVAELTGEYLLEDTIMTERLARRKLRIRNLYEYNPLRHLKIAQILSTPLVTVGSREKALDVYKKMNQPGHEYWSKKRIIVVTPDDKAIGVVDREYLHHSIEHLESLDNSQDATIEEFTSDSFLRVKESEIAYEALVLMSLNDLPGLVVVDGSDTAIGYLSRGDLIRAQKDKIFDERVIQHRRICFAKKTK